MSQEIQLSLTQPGNGTQLQTPSWSGPAPGVLGPSAPSAPASPLAKAHQHLRGRYALVLIIGGIFAAMFGGAGFLFFHPSYQSIGRIEIDPVVPSPDQYDHIIPLWQAYVATVVTNLKSESVLREAMRDPEWKAHRPNPPEAYLASMQKDLTVKLATGSFDIEITYADDHKDGKVVAPIYVTAIINAYYKLYGADEKNEFDRKIDVWKKKQTVLNQQINMDVGLIDMMLQNLGENPQVILEKKYEAHFVLQGRIRDLEEELRVERAELKQAQDQAGDTPYTIEALARVDTSMAEMYHIRASQELEVQQLTQRLGTAHPAVITARRALDDRIAAMNTYAQLLRDKYFIKLKADGSGGVLIPKDLSIKEANLTYMQGVFTEEQQQLDDLGHRVTEIEKRRKERSRFEEERLRVDKRIDDFTTQKEMANTFRVIDRGGVASIGTDKRIVFGGVGVLFGFAAPVGLMLLASLMNPRFRFSDEATNTQQAAGLALLGILPDLPDRLSDPEQASIAAHCVHQIRTMLQINTAGSDDRRVFAVTSAAPADGKTSLTLALGLSYAACGTRTLLIDCDLIGAGLTSRLNVVASEGVLEAIAHRTLLEYVRSTDIADVSILPVGSGQQLHASTLSPAALRRLIEEAKKHFDTILIDTGPVLGSIEASLVAAAADAVVLTVSRGQQRPLVEKTVAHLHNIKANVAGVVFNRAQTDDFDKSISGISLRSAASGSSYNAPRMGPVARAVQSAFRPAGEDIN